VKDFYRSSRSNVSVVPQGGRGRLRARIEVTGELPTLTELLTTTKRAVRSITRSRDKSSCPGTRKKRSPLSTSHPSRPRNRRGRRVARGHPPRLVRLHYIPRLEGGNPRALENRALGGRRRPAATHGAHAMPGSRSKLPSRACSWKTRPGPGRSLCGGRPGPFSCPLRAGFEMRAGGRASSPVGIYAWLAADEAGHVAVFTNGARDPVPVAVLAEHPPEQGAPLCSSA
jgi:hypothetical protein